MNKLTILSNWDKARQAIAACKTIDEVKKIRDQAEALRAYAKQAKESLEVQNNVAEIKIRAERKIGEFSKELPVAQGNARFNTSHDGKNKILKDAGIEHYERYEAIASLPEKLFEKHVLDVKRSNEELTTVGIIRMARKLETKKRRMDLGTKEFPKGTYQVIYADPPWDVKAGPDWGSGEESRELLYPTMSLKEIMDLPVETLADKNAHLYLWTINKYIYESYDIARAWGFEPSCLLTWVKPTHGIGLGGTFIQTTEHILFCRRGSLDVKKRIDTTWFAYKRGKHSEKPKEFRTMIENVSPGNRIELFARQKSKGWDSWGNEI